VWFQTCNWLDRPHHTGAVQNLRQVIPQITEDIVAALRLCTNLTSATWVDDTLTPEANFLPILEVLMTLPLRELTIRTQYDPGERVWARLNTIQGIRRLSVWSLEWGPPRVLQGWADLLSSSLTHLELGVRELYDFLSLFLIPFTALCRCSRDHPHLCLHETSSFTRALSQGRSKRRNPSYNCLFAQSDSP
jgi:hypothetical protein